MDWRRWIKHLNAPDRMVRQAFPPPTMAAIEAAVAASEAGHRGEIRFVVEGGLPWRDLWRDTTPRQRALALFAELGVWDTADNSGILVYVQLVDHRIEILADRGINAKVPQDQWDALCRGMEQAFRDGRWLQGVLDALAAATALLERHFPAAAHNPNELPDQPVIL